MVAVSDEDILDAMRLLGRTSGIFGEPAGVAGLAGLRYMAGNGVIRSDEKIVVIVTGNGLKDVKNAIAGRRRADQDRTIHAAPDGRAVTDGASW